jgi:hypothetical protein
LLSPLLHFGTVGDIHLVKLGIGSQGFDHFLPQSLRNITNDDLCPFPGKDLRCGFPNPGGSSGDHCHFPIQTHDPSFN